MLLEIQIYNVGCSYYDCEVELEEDWPDDPLSYLTKIDMQDYVQNIVRRCSSLEHVSLSVDVRFQNKPLMPLSLWRVTDAGTESAAVKLVAENEHLPILKTSPFFGRRRGGYGKERC